MDGWTVAWLLWVALFFAIELPAIHNRSRNDTLSEKVWHWFSIGFKQPGWRLRRLTLVAFLVWLVLHFLTGGWV